MDCPFCKNNILEEKIIYRDNLFLVFPTNMPIVPGHVLICPVRHISSLEEFTHEDWTSLKNIINKMKAILRKSFQAEGFNIAWNEGESAGQSVSHLHIHIVPRKLGDAGIYNYEPRQFLYRPGFREKKPEKELIDVAKQLRSYILN